MAVARVEFLNLGAIDILDWIILRGGGGEGVLSFALEDVAASLVLIHQMPVAPSQ